MKGSYYLITTNDKMAWMFIKVDINRWKRWKNTGSTYLPPAWLTSSNAAFINIALERKCATRRCRWLLLLNQKCYLHVVQPCFSCRIVQSKSHVRYGKYLYENIIPVAYRTCDIYLQYSKYIRYTMRFYENTDPVLNNKLYIFACTYWAEERHKLWNPVEISSSILFQLL